MKTALAFCLLAGCCLGQEGATSSSSALAEKVQEVPQSAVQSAFQILRSEYIRGEELTFDELNRAAFQGLLERLDLGAELVRKTDAERPPQKRGVLAEMLTERAAYLRPLSFAESEPADMETHLKKWAKEGVPYLIVDLRSAVPPGDFAVASAMLELFVPQGELLFKLKQVGREDAQLFISSREPVWTKPLVLLADAETCNLGETVAAALQARRQAVVLGSKTRGATVRYETLPLDTDWQMRFARAEMLLPGDKSLFRQGVMPDFLLDLAAETKRQVFDAAGPVKDSLFDQSRPRYNEAALIARKNPELDSYIRRSAGETLSDDRPLVRDTVLQRAVDMLEMRTHLQGESLKWPVSRASTKAVEPPTVKKDESAPKP